MKSFGEIQAIILLLIGIFTLSFTLPNKSLPKGSCIQGKVISADDGSGIQNAYVILYEGSTKLITLKTNPDGGFVFRDLPPATYDVVVKKKNYETLVEYGIKTEAGKSATLTLEITPVKEPVEEFDDELNDVYYEKEIMQEAKSRPLMNGSRGNGKKASWSVGSAGYASQAYEEDVYIDYNTESYDIINENIFKEVVHNPLSTFSIDVDKASYSNVRRFLNSNTMPVKDAVRIEELVNYFDYDYPQPKNGDPFSVNLEIADCPWNADHQLLMIGLQGEDISTDSIPSSNLVFLIDVSGSMDDPGKLPLLKQSFKLLLNNLRDEDRVAIVVYAGAAGCVLESTPGTAKEKIISALEMLEAGGSTAGGEGIALAYKIAKENYIPGGNNRVILATDGDFNVGPSSDAEMTRLIEEKRDDGIFLTALGFGMGNYKDSKMEQISNAGNGNYAYIDNIMEAKKVFGEELWGSLYTIAKDVKIQVEFNPAQVKAYRLIGYENRMLEKEDFNNDKKDAGDIGCGHTVTALYEIIPAGSGEEVSHVDPLEYQNSKTVNSNNLLTVKLRYKEPDKNESKLITIRKKEDEIRNVIPSENFRFAASVAEFGMLLRDSEHKSNSSYEDVLALAKESAGEDKYGYRSDFIKLVETAKLLSD